MMMYGTDHYESLLRAQREANELFERLETASPTEDEVALQERYPETFSGGKPSRHGWAGVIVSLAGEKFGDDDAVASKNIHAIFTHLEMTLEELHQHA